LILRGVKLFVALCWFTKQPRRTGAESGLFLLVYWSSRFSVEFSASPIRIWGSLPLAGWLWGSC